MRGRPPKVLAHPNIDATHPLAGAPACPKDLCTVGKQKWKQLVKELQVARILTKLDGDALRDYCLAYVEELDARKMLAACPNPYFLAGEHGGVYMNPLRHVVNKAREQMAKLRQELGLAPVSRTRLGITIGASETVKKVPSRDRSKGPPPPTARNAQ